MGYSRDNYVQSDSSLGVKQRLNAADEALNHSGCCFMTIFLVLSSRAKFFLKPLELSVCPPSTVTDFLENLRLLRLKLPNSSGDDWCLNSKLALPIIAIGHLLGTTRRFGHLITPDLDLYFCWHFEIAS